MLLIGLTGGIGAGKSTVATRFHQLGAYVVDADVMARTAVAKGSTALQQIQARFGSGVITADGELDRKALGSIVFSDSQARKDLESIVHPAVHTLTTAEFAKIRAQDSNAVVVYDVPLLIEAKNTYDFDRIVVVHAPAETRIQRLISLRGMTPDEARARVNSQASDDERLAVADDVITSDGSLEETYAQVDLLWQKLSHLET